MTDLFEINTPQKKILKVEPQKEITTYLNYSLPMSSFFWNKSKHAWILNHFTNIYLLHEKNNYIWLDYLESDYFFSEVLYYQVMNIDETRKISDIIRFLKERIEEGNHIRLIVDRFYISMSNSHYGEHVPLQLFLCGYDNDAKEFIGVGFSDDFRFKMLKYSYNEVEKGFRSFNESEMTKEIWAEWYSCILLNPSKEEEYSFDINKFCSSLYNYVNSIPAVEELRPDIVYEKGKKATFGLKSQLEIIEALHLLARNEIIMDYRHIHLISEHKNQIMNKMRYVASLFQQDKQIFESNLTTYGIICEEFNIMRFAYLKQVLTDTNFKNLFGQLLDKDIITYITRVFEKNIELEHQVLTDFLLKTRNLTS